MLPVVLYQYTPPLFFKGSEWSVKIKLRSFFVLSLPSHLMENLFTTIFNFNEYIFVYVVNIVFICDGEMYLLRYVTYLENDGLVKNTKTQIS